MATNPVVRGLGALYAGTFFSGAWAMIKPTIPVLARQFDVSAGSAAQIITAFAIGKFVGTVIAGVLLGSDGHPGGSSQRAAGGERRWASPSRNWAAASRRCSAATWRTALIPACRSPFTRRCGCFRLCSPRWSARKLWSGENVS